MNSDRYEVIVCGGGMVGAATACALAHGGIKVALLERFNPERQWPPEPIDIRVSALSHASRNILATLEAWPGMVRRGVCPYREMRVWDAQGDGELHFDCADTRFDELGHITENRVTVAALWDVLDSLPSADCITPATVVDMRLLADGRQLQLQDGRLLEADLVIAADGRDSSLRTLAGIGVTGWPYRQDGLVATVSTEQSHRFTAWQRFLPEGPLAFLPLQNGQCSIVWTLSTETSKQHVAMEDREFLAALEQASGGILGRMLDVGPRAAFPLRFQYANCYIDRHFAVCGDAAHAMHPLAGQGVNAGLLDAAAIAELIIETKRDNRPLSGTRLLRRYERWRKGDNLIMMSSMDLLNKTYRFNAKPLVDLRSAGMNSINRLGPVKAFFNRYAMGLRDDLPKLARGLVCW